MERKGFIKVNEEFLHIMEDAMRREKYCRFDVVLESLNIEAVQKNCRIDDITIYRSKNEGKFYISFEALDDQSRWGFDVPEFCDYYIDDDNAIFTFTDNKGLEIYLTC